MLGASVRSIFDTIRTPRASAEDEVAFEAFLVSWVALYGCVGAIVLNAAHLLFWPTDAMLLPNPTVLAATRWLRVTTFANHLLAQGGNGPDLSDEITRGSLVTHRGEIVHDAVKAALARSGS